MTTITHIGLLALLIVLSMNLAVFALYTHTLMPGLKKLPDTQFVRAFQTIDRHIINPFFMSQFFSPLLIFAALVLISFSDQAANFGTLITGLVCYFAVVVVTVAVNVPLNDGIKKVSDQALSEQSAASIRSRFNESRWLLANNARMLLCFLAVIFAAISL